MIIYGILKIQYYDEEGPVWMISEEDYFSSYEDAINKASDNYNPKEWSIEKIKVN